MHFSMKGTSCDWFVTGATRSNDAVWHQVMVLEQKTSVLCDELHKTSIFGMAVESSFFQQVNPNAWIWISGFHQYLS